MDLFDLFAKITLDDSEYNKGLDDASGKASGFADKLKSGLSTAAKVGGAALGAASAGVAALTKASIDNYAEYEQLVGGVDTLFKDSSGKVQEYAANAYQTAGMSANQYMETVTSFSASLLQSLNGDTAKAAEVADQAITDMSDNANKMGTSMESIQNAYQGFAKQNYTMLDNLKLGYGGTKEEMQRLLEDAEKLSGQKFDLSSYADIVEAIHVVQTEMGITGTTAKEASSTIEGSIASMKGAWSNLVTGIADENADMGELIGNVVESVVTVGENVIPRVQQILGGIGEAVQQIAPIISEQLPTLIETVLPSLLDAGTSLLTGLVDGIVSAAPALVDAAISALSTLASYLIENLPMLADSAMQIVSTLVSSIGENLPQILEAGGQMLDQLTSGIEDGLPDMISRLPQIIEDFLNFITDNLPGILDKGVEVLNSLVDGIIGAIPEMVAALPDIITSFKDFFVENFPKIIESGGEILGNLIAGILGAIPEIAASLPDVISAIVDALEEGWQAIEDAGRYLLEGLWSGISDKVGWLKDKITGVIDTIKGWFTGKSGFDEHSPSRWSNQVFRRVLEGGSQGLDAGLPGLMSDVGSVVNRVKSSMNFGTANVDFAVSGAGRMSSDIGSASRNSSTESEQPITIVVQSVLDGKVIGETAYRYTKNYKKAYQLG